MGNLLSIMLPAALMGAAMGWLALLLMVLLARSKQPRSIIRLESSDDLWPVIEAWCAHNRYKLRRQEGKRRHYQRGIGFWQAAARLEVTHDGTHWQLEACIVLSALVTESEMALHERGFLAKLPREDRKSEFDTLLRSLGHAQL